MATAVPVSACAAGAGVFRLRTAFCRFRAGGFLDAEADGCGASSGSATELVAIDAALTSGRDSTVAETVIEPPA